MGCPGQHGELRVSSLLGVTGTSVERLRWGMLSWGSQGLQKLHASGQPGRGQDVHSLPGRNHGSTTGQIRVLCYVQYWREAPPPPWHLFQGLRFVVRFRVESQGASRSPKHISSSHKDGGRSSPDQNNPLVLLKEYSYVSNFALKPKFELWLSKLVSPVTFILRQSLPAGMPRVDGR